MFDYYTKITLQNVVSRESKGDTRAGQLVNPPMSNENQFVPIMKK